MRGLTLGMVTIALLAGCTPDPVRPEAPPPPATSATSATTGSASPSPVRGARTIATGLDVPWDFAVLPDQSVLITLRDRAEIVRVIPGDRVDTVAEVPGVEPGGEGGLLGLALSPDFATDQLIYLYFTAADDNRVVRFRYRPDGLSDATPIVTGIPKAGNHNGGRLRFGPDGDLYIGTGDAADGRNAQDRDSLGGKILRVTPDGAAPADNPFGNAVYSYGHRNVQGLGWNSAGTMYASEFGQNAWDELNVIKAGANYGWPQTEGDTEASGVTAPVAVWRTSEASPSGIAVAPSGDVYLAALRGERVWLVPSDGDGTGEPEVFLDGLGRIRTVAVIDGELWVLTNNTSRGDPRDGDDRLIVRPLR